MTAVRDPLDGVESLDIRQDTVAGRRFRIADPARRELLIAAEESAEFARSLLGGYRPHDAIGREVYRIRRHPEDPQVFRAWRGDRQAALLQRLTHATGEEELRIPEYLRMSFSPDLSLAHRRLLLGSLFLVHEDGFGKPRAG